MEHGYATTIDTGSLVRAELAECGSHQPSRAEQRAFASQMIRRHGGGYFTDRLLAALPGPHLVDGPRRQIEIEHLLEAGAIVLFVDADVNVRFERSKVRNTERDKASLDAFLAQDRVEWGFDPTLGGHEVRRGDRYERDLTYAKDNAHAWFYNERPPRILRLQLARFMYDLEAGEVGPGSKWRPKIYREPMPLG